MGGGRWEVVGERREERGEGIEKQKEKEKQRRTNTKSGMPMFTRIRVVLPWGALSVPGASVSGLPRRELPRLPVIRHSLHNRFSTRRSIGML